MDNFAQIAKNGIQGRRELLETPEPAESPEHVFFLHTDRTQPTELPQHMQTAKELSQALEEKRCWAQPFLRNLAPQLESPRTVQILTQFCWKKQQDKEWKHVTLPHFEGPLGKASTVYKSKFSLENRDSRRVFLVINGADYKAAVFVNDRLAGTHEGFFASFEFDVTELVHKGENDLRIELDNDFVMQGSFTEDDVETKHRFYGDKIYAATGPGYDDPQVGWHHCPPGMGILEPIRVELRQACFIDEIFARTLKDEIEFWIEVTGCSYVPSNIHFDLSVYGQNLEQVVAEHIEFTPSTGKELGLGDTFTEARARREGTLHASLPLPCYKGRNLYKVRIPAGQMKWWSPQEPWLYQAQLILKDENGRTLDTMCQQFGRRTFTQDMESERKGMFYLNGAPIRLRGANTMGFEQLDVMRADDHQLIDDILLGKICNMNFWRLTQRPVQRRVYEFCDRLGMMIQTDLPLFGCLRRHKFCEAVRQAEEMERHVRRHACCILDTYINEPFPNAFNMPNSSLERAELEDFFDAADIAVHLANPDRVTKHVDGDYDPPNKKMPDSHCYPMWYNGHGIDIGKLHKGYWMPVKPGWYYGCGEFGCEGLESPEMMRAAYPADWLPQPGEPEQAWTPKRMRGQQSSDFYHFFFDRPQSLEEWSRESQSFQALATRMMTEAFRRDDRMVSFAIHLFIDAWPAGWMKTIMDCRRQPKPAYFAYRDALAPVLVSLRTDKTHFFGGETAKAEGWLCNDTEKNGKYRLRYELVKDNIVIASHEQDTQLKAMHAYCDGVAEFRFPEVEQRTVYRLRAMLLDPKTRSCEAWNELEYTVLPSCAKPIEMRIRTIDRISPEDIKAAENGAVLWIDKPESGDYTVAGAQVHVWESGMSPYHFASTKTGHAWTQGFCPEDFRHWYSSEEDCIVPLADCTVQAEGFDTVLASRNLDSQGCWQPATLMCERTFGKGCIVISQISYRQMLDNPAGCILLSRIRL